MAARQRARGLGASQEKTLVLIFCARTQATTDATQTLPSYDADCDQYVDLDDRFAIARKATASLFISVQADTLIETQTARAPLSTLSPIALPMRKLLILRPVRMPLTRPLEAAVGRTISTCGPSV